MAPTTTGDRWPALAQVARALHYLDITATPHLTAALDAVVAMRIVPSRPNPFLRLTCETVDSARNLANALTLTSYSAEDAITTRDAGTLANHAWRGVVHRVDVEVVAWGPPPGTAGAGAQPATLGDVVEDGPHLDPDGDLYDHVGVLLGRGWGRGWTVPVGGAR